MPRRTPILLLAAALLLSAAVATAGEGYRDLENQVQEFTLDNGIHFMVLERHDVPVFSFRTYVNVGSVNEVTGITGIAHILEHMAFKGTPEIGTTDYKKERKALERVDAAFLALKAERRKGARADSTRLTELEAAFEQAKEDARQYVVSNEFGQIVENNGGNGMNASTSCDATNYFYNMPANRLELWAYLEGSRMAHPVLREFYTEKDGPVTEERRMRTDNNPIGRLIEQFQNLAFMAHPYHHATIGYMSDLQSITRQDCRDFYDRWYVGNNMSIAVVGDVKFAQVKKLAEKYFRDIPGPVALDPIETVEPPQQGEKRIVIEDDSQPVYVCGYHKPGALDPDAAAYAALADILGQGRTSRLYKTLVKEKKLCAFAGSFSGYPGTKYPNLLMIFAMPNKDVPVADVEEAIFAEVDRIKDEGVTEEELAGVKRRAKASFIRSLEGNQGLAGQLCYYQAIYGDWREMFRQLDKIDAVTTDDVQRVARKILNKKNRTVAYIEHKSES